MEMKGWREGKLWLELAVPSSSVASLSASGYAAAEELRRQLKLRAFGTLNGFGRLRTLRYVP